MSLTRGEKLAVVLRASKYPKNYGHCWGYGPLQAVEQDKLPALLREHPEFLEYG